jgi:hypothetical protein
LFIDYPDDAVRAAFATALEHGLLDVRRIERVVLQRVRADFFRLPANPGESDG